MKKVPQIIDKTGISADYFIEYATKLTVFSQGDILKVSNLFKEYPVKKYEEKFPNDEYDDVVNEKNEKRVEELDKIVEIVNTQMIDQDKFDKDDFKRIMNKVGRLIYGDDHVYYEDV